MPLASFADLLPKATANVKHDPLQDMRGDHVHFMPSTARKAIALGYVTDWRIYELLKHYDRLMLKGEGKFELDEKILSAVAAAANLTPIRVKRIIRQSVPGIFWTLTIGKQWRADDILYVTLTKRAKVEAQLSEIAEGEDQDIYDPTRVTKRKAYLNVEDFKKLQRLEALCFAAWINDRKDGKDHPTLPNDSGAMTIPLYELERAWGRDHKIIQRWVKLAGITVKRNRGYANIKEHGEKRIKWLQGSLSNNGVYHWREKQRVFYPRANTYIAPSTAQRGTRSISRKTAADIRSGGDALRIRTNHDWPSEAKGYKRIDRQIDRDPFKTHHMLSHELNRGFRKGHPVGFYKLHYLAGSRVNAD
jgi:hypothetical protein